MSAENGGAPARPVTTVAGDPDLATLKARWPGVDIYTSTDGAVWFARPRDAPPSRRYLTADSAGELRGKLQAALGTPPARGTG